MPIIEPDPNEPKSPQEEREAFHRLIEHFLSDLGVKDPGKYSYFFVSAAKIASDGLFDGNITFMRDIKEDE